MEDNIVNKLNSFLSQDRKIDESFVVYFFVEIRKIIDQLNIEERKCFSIIKFYADWCVHTRKDDLRGFRKYLEGIAENIERDVRMTFVEFLTTPNRRHSLAPLVEAEELKNELEIFLTKKSISLIVLSDKNKWFEFRNMLGRVLADQPLDFGDKPVGNLKIKEIRFLETKQNLVCAFLISVTTADGKRMGPFIFGGEKNETF